MAKKKGKRIYRQATVEEQQIPAEWDAIANTDQWRHYGHLARWLVG